jgi:ABC-type siderophore export system fused ATPase/permease subunit|tara:strand:- start:130 stop:315 length:186 start_codon:yes stop_codon:yes gene_type:complete
MIITGLLAGAAKTMVVSMLSERVVLRVLLMLAEWASAKSTTTIDDKIVNEIRTKLEADGKI